MYDASETLEGRERDIGLCYPLMCDPEAKRDSQNFLVGYNLKPIATTLNELTPELKATVYELIKFDANLHIFVFTYQ